MSKIKGAPLSARQKSPRLRENYESLFTWAIGVYKARYARFPSTNPKRLTNPNVLLGLLSVEGVRNDLNLDAINDLALRNMLTRFRHLSMDRRLVHAQTFVDSGSVNLEVLRLADSNGFPQQDKSKFLGVTLTDMSFPKDKLPPKPLEPPKNPIGIKVEVPRIQVRVVHESTENESGSDGGHYGDVLLRGHVIGGNGSSRYTIALKLREMADQIVNTVGDPMVSASITVLMSRPRK